MKKYLRKIGIAVVIIFAVIGFVLTAGYFAIRFGLTNSSGIVDTQRQNFLTGGNDATDATSTEYYWETLPEWQTLATALSNDQPALIQASNISGVPARMIIAPLVSEQMRFFFDDRASYEKYFAPLKILGDETQFSWGVMGIKEATAVQIENNLKDPTSPYYLGAQYAHLLDFATNTNIQEERFTRLTDPHNHYYNYLYGALYIAEVEHQWKTAGFDISNRPDVIATLYNIGFIRSVPKANPEVGGAPIPIGNQTYAFGQLAGQFYNSNELTSEFPK
jgi:hypothetical protein